jgi:hypothetical protein
MDIKKFHCTVSLHPSHKPYLISQDPNGGFWVDHCFCFGASPASSNSGMISAALRDIWKCRGVFPVAKIEDDLAVFCLPGEDGTYAYDRESVLAIISCLGTPWHTPDKKGDPFFIDIFTFIGLLWDIPRHRVSLPEEKRLKYLHHLSSFLSNYAPSRKPIPTPSIPTNSALQSQNLKAPLNDVEVIHGTLCYITFIYIEGRLHLPAISNFMSSYRNWELEFGKYLTNGIIRELEWWVEVLQEPGRYHQLKPRSPLIDLRIYVDASMDWGIGIWIKEKFAAYKLKDGWKIEGRDICWLETLAIELVAYYLEAMGFEDIYVLMHSDNKGMTIIHRLTISSHIPNRYYWSNG